MFTSNRERDRYYKDWFHTKEVSIGRGDTFKVGDSFRYDGSNPPRRLTIGSHDGYVYLIDGNKVFCDRFIKPKDIDSITYNELIELSMDKTIKLL